MDLGIHSKDLTSVGNKGFPCGIANGTVLCIAGGVDPDI